MTMKIPNQTGSIPAETTIGMTIGSYAGAKFTRRAPLWLLRSAIILTPFTAGTLLMFF